MEYRRFELLENLLYECSDWKKRLPSILELYRQPLTKKNISIFFENDDDFMYIQDKNILVYRDSDGEFKRANIERLETIGQLGTMLYFLSENVNIYWKEEVYLTEAYTHKV